MASRVVPNLAKVRGRGRGLFFDALHFATTLVMPPQIYNKVDVYPLVACVGVAVSFCVYKGTEHLLVRSTECVLLSRRKQHRRLVVCRATPTLALTPREDQLCLSTQRTRALPGRLEYRGTTCTRTIRCTTCLRLTPSALRTGCDDRKCKQIRCSTLVREQALWLTR